MDPKKAEKLFKQAVRESKDAILSDRNLLPVLGYMVLRGVPRLTLENSLSDFIRNTARSETKLGQLEPPASLHPRALFDRWRADFIAHYREPMESLPIDSGDIHFVLGSLSKLVNEQGWSLPHFETVRLAGSNLFERLSFIVTSELHGVPGPLFKPFKKSDSTRWFMRLL